MKHVPDDAYTFLCRFARRHKRKAWSPEQAIGQAATLGIEFSDARHWGPVFRRVAAEKRIEPSGMFKRATSNRSVRPGWVGV